MFNQVILYRKQLFPFLLIFIFVKYFYFTLLDNEG